MKDVNFIIVSQALRHHNVIGVMYYRIEPPFKFKIRIKWFF